MPPRRGRREVGATGWWRAAPARAARGGGGRGGGGGGGGGRGRGGVGMPRSGGGGVSGGGESDGGAGRRSRSSSPTRESRSPLNPRRQGRRRSTSGRLAGKRRPVLS